MKSQIDALTGANAESAERRRMLGPTGLAVSGPHAGTTLSLLAERLEGTIIRRASLDLASAPPTESIPLAVTVTAPSSEALSRALVRLSSTPFGDPQVVSMANDRGNVSAELRVMVAR